MILLAAAVLAAAPSQQFNWSVPSVKGTAVLTQTALPDDACTLKCEVKGKEAWTQKSCLGRVTDFVFPADDCSSALMLVEYPLRAAPTELTVAAMSLTAVGTPVVVSTKLYRLQDLMDVSRLRGEGKRVRWLAGVAGEPGAKPHFNEAENGIEFGTSDGTRRTVRFTEDLALKRVLAAPQAAQVSAGGTGMYQYTGADGSTYFVMGLAQVPQKYRKSAAPVGAEIDTVQSATMTRPSAPERSQPAYVTNGGWPPPNAAPQVGVVQPAQRGNGEIFGLPGPAGDAVLQREGLRRRAELPNSSQPPALPPKPPGSAYVQPPSPYK